MDKVSQNRKIALLAERSAAEAKNAAPADQSVVGKAISTANTALAVHGQVMGAYGKVMGATGALAEKAVVAVFSKLAFMQGLACLPASSQMDPVMGIDVHLVMIPPSPSPVPMPHPYIAMVFNPKDFIACAVMSAVASIPPPPADSAGLQLASTVGKMALGMVMAKLGLGASVKLGGFTPRTVTGTANKVIPHFPMGASFAPIPILKNSGHAQFGSLFLLADGEPFTGMMHLNNDCWDIGIMQLMRKKAPAEPMHLFMPTGFVMAIPSHNVIVNPIPTPINPIAALTKMFNFGIAKLLHKLIRKLPGGRLANALHKAVCHVTGHPVDIASGMLFTDEEDFALPGVIPFSWERTWYSDSIYKGPLGHGWYHNYDMGFSIDESNSGIFRMNDGRLVGFQLPERGKFMFDRAEKFFLHCHAEEGFYYVVDKEGLIYRFTDKLYPNRVNQKGEQLLQSISNTNGYAIRFEYNHSGALIRITDSAGRQLNIDNDRLGRITSIHAPHPDELNQTFPISRYEYDEHGNMICHTDALGQQMKYEYKDHLLVKETWRNGMQWYFEYDGNKPGAKCIHTWGDGDLYNHKLTYQEGITLVENSLGHFTTYNLNGGLISSKIDGNGAEWKYRYNQFNELEWETDPLGNQQSYTHDEWGSIATCTDPDNGFTHTEYFNPHYPLLATEEMDEAGGKWKWSYNELGNLTESIDPLGAKTGYVYEDGLLIKVIYADGATTSLRYDNHQNLTFLITNDGAITEYSYDALGNCTRIVNPAGVKQKTTVDLKGREIYVQDFDGNTISLEYDGLDNLIKYRDKQKEIRYTYKGLWKLTSRSENGATILFKYDTEEQLLKVINEHNLSYTFKLDPAGNVIEEINFDDSTRSYERNLAGWVTELRRPGNKSTRCEYDKSGRITRLMYSDGGTEAYVYRSDGEIIKAINESATVTYQRDVLGNVLTENINGEWITSEYNILGNRINTKSSLGADISEAFNKMGDVVTMQSAGWLANFEYNILGLETQKFMPGGVISERRWDGIGRPVGHTVENKRQPAYATFHRQYKWEVNDVLKELKSEKGVTRFEHDRWNHLSKTTYPNGEVQLRNPDPIGNLYKTIHRDDRLYSKAGQLKKANGWIYSYDSEGNLTGKINQAGESWKFCWNDAGMLVKVIRPDKLEVAFSYDALGRRVCKTFKNTTTNYLWDNNVILHEWKTHASTKEKLSEKHFPENGTITWLFDSDSQAPCAKIKGDKHYSIITDYLGTPSQMYKEDGTLFWESELDSYGLIRMEKGESGSCPFRFLGQYEDEETGLYYNRFRYYSPYEGIYISQDPIDLEGENLNFYAYSLDPNIEIDFLGLKIYRRKSGKFGKKPGPKRKNSGHGNGKGSKKPCILYAMFDGKGNFKKWGITNKVTNPRGRYGNKIPKSYVVKPVAAGKRSSMLKTERELAEKRPGPRNKESWAGDKKGQPLSKKAQAAQDAANAP